MAKNKRYRKKAIRMKLRCRSWGCNKCIFDRDMIDGWGSCDYVFRNNGDMLPRELSINQISDSLKGLTNEKLLRSLDD